MSKELRNTKSAWRDLYALGSMKQALNFLKQIQSESILTRGDLKWPLYIAFFVTYSKPFTNNKDMGSISIKAVPDKYKSLHKSITKARDYMYGHTDPLESADDNLPVNQIFIRSTKDDFEVFVNTMMLSDKELPAAQDLVESVIAFLNKQTLNIYAHLKAEYKNQEPGDYEFPYPKDMK